MKVTETQIRKLEITEVPNLDPISVMIEEYGVGQAKIVIQCWDRSWNVYFGSMGSNLKEFFTRTNVHYLTDKFSTEIERKCMGLDHYAMQQEFVKKVRERVIEMRREWPIDADVARTVYDQCEGLNLSDIAPQHPYDDWKMDHWSLCESSWECIFYDKDCFNEWCYDNVRDIYEENHDYVYLGRIVTAVREAIINQEG